MSDFRPICDTWLLGRPKVKYYGAFPSGFVERARALLGIGYLDPLLHVCSGRVRDYPFRGVGPKDRTVDADPELAPDFCMDVRRLGVAPGDLFPLEDWRAGSREVLTVRDDVQPSPAELELELWPAVLADPPYSASDAEHYRVGSKFLPPRADLLRRCLSIVRPGGRVGFLDVIAPRPPKAGVRLVALVSVFHGYGNQMRVFSVYERLTEHDARDRERAREAVRGKALSRDVLA